MTNLSIRKMTTQLMSEPSILLMVLPASAPMAGPIASPSTPASHVVKSMSAMTVSTYIIALNTTLLLALKVFLRFMVKEMISAMHFDTSIAMKPAVPNAPSLPAA